MIRMLRVLLIGGFPVDLHESLNELLCLLRCLLREPTRYAPRADAQAEDRSLDIDHHQLALPRALFRLAASEVVRGALESSPCESNTVAIQQPAGDGS